MMPFVRYIMLSYPLDLQIAEAEALDDSTRQLATEFLVTLCEAREKAPGMMRKLPQIVGRLFQCLMTFLLDIEVLPQPSRLVLYAFFRHHISHVCIKDKLGQK